MRGNATVNTAMVPLASMFGYVNNLRSMSRGRASFNRSLYPRGFELPTYLYLAAA